MNLLRRFGPSVAAVVVAVAAIIGLMERPSTVSAAHRADYVIIVGSAGLRWDDVDKQNTPTMWRLAQQDSIGALSVRSAHSPTCPADGWVTLGAGNYARRTTGATDGPCAAVGQQPASPDGIGADVADQENVVADNRVLSYGAQPGALADAVRCTFAIGPGAALAAARPFGRVDRYSAVLPGDPTQMLGTCTLSIVDLGSVDGQTPAVRAIQAHLVDEALARVLASRPPKSLVIVAGLSDTDRTSRLHVAIADGPGYVGGWLTSISTGRAGYLQLVDLAPTALAALGRPLPAKLFAGGQAQKVAGRPADPGAAVAVLSDADHEVTAQERVGGWFYGGLAAAETLLLIAAIPMLRRARRSAEPHGPAPVPPRLLRYAERALVAAGVAIAAAVLADVFPWWRSPAAGLIFILVSMALAAAATAAVLTGPWRRGALGPLGAAAAVCVAVLGADVLTGSSLQLNGVAGYSAAGGSRYAGIGPAGLGVFIVGVLLLAGSLAQRSPSRRWRPAIVAAVVALGVIVVGSPYLGADAGGAVALTAGGCIAAAIASGGWLTFARLAWATLTGLVVLIGFAALDLTRPVAQRGPLGQFITQFHDGTAGATVHRTAVADVVVTVTNPLTLFAVVALLYNVFVLFRAWGGLMRLFGLYPAIRGAMTGIGVAAVLAGVFDGAGLTTAGAAAAMALPLVTLAALRVLDHADDRTVARALGAEAPAEAPVAHPAEPAPPGDQVAVGPAGPATPA